jgi:membrane protein implicated in regulation of membrane protease activity
MSIFYLILLVVSTTAFIAGIFLNYVEKIKHFGVGEEGRKLFRLPVKFSEIIPADKLLPENFTMLLLAVMAASGGGSVYTMAGMPWYISLPCSLATGLLLCFAVQHYAEKVADTLKRNTLPRGEKASGLDGYCTVKFDDGYGKVKLFHKDREFEVQAGVFEEDVGEIAVFDKVIAVYESGGFYFVVKPADVFTGIDTKF